MRFSKTLALAALGFAAFKMGGAQAAPQHTTPATPETASATPSTVAGWSAFVDGIRDLPERILARLPENLRNDPQVQQEVGRLALSAVTSGGLKALASDPNYPVFIPSLNNYITTGQPNADTNYRSAQIAPGGTYRLRGTRGTMNHVRLALMSPPSAKDKAPRRLEHDLNALSVDAEGRYDVLLSPKKPEGYTGDWWELPPTANNILLRMVGQDWSKEREPTLSIERLDVPAAKPRTSAGDLQIALESIPAFANMIAPLMVDRPTNMRKEGILNAIKIADFSEFGVLNTQFYFEGAYDLKEDEALILETTIPKKCLYNSLILTNDIYETTDWYNHQSSLNGAQTRLDSDGKLRVVISARDPGVPNWLDTAGYPSGVIQGRWMECDSQPIPTIRKVRFADLGKNLPKDTPRISLQEREQIVRDRRAALQQRPLW